VTEGIAGAGNPLLVVLSNADGIVPEATALSAYHTMGSSKKEILRVGTEAVPVAHADLFVSDIAQKWVFEPLAQWLIAQHRSPSKKERPSRRTKVSPKTARRQPSRPSRKKPSARAGKKRTRKKPK
jgi:hypothetical protein